MPSNKLNLSLNSQVYKEIISVIAKHMGTSNRNVMALAMTDIFKHTYTKKYIDQLLDEITLDHVTVITINESTQEKLDDVERHGYSKRVYFGLLVSAYFIKHQSALLPPSIQKSISFQTQTDPDESKGHIEFELSKEHKNQIEKYCEVNSMTPSSLYSHFLLYEDIELLTYEIEKKAKYNISLNEHVKNVLINRSDESNCSYKFFLQLVTRQIIGYIEP